VVAKSGSPLGRLPLKLRWIKGEGLQAEEFNCEPALDTYTADHSWSITGPADKSGTFQFELVGEGMTTPIELPECVLLSKNFADEGAFLVDGVELSDSTVFTRGVARALTLVPKAGSPLANLTKSLQWHAGTGLVKADLTCTPVLDLPTKLNSWQITGSATKSGTFQCKLVVQGVSAPILLPICILLSNNLADEADIKIDGQNVADGGVVFLRKRSRKVQLVAKPTSPIDKLQLIMKYEIISGITPGTIKSSPAFDSETLSREWDVGFVTEGDGLFKLEVFCPLQGGSLYVDCRQINVGYSVNGESIELVDGVGSGKISNWGKHVFLVGFSEAAVGTIVDVGGGSWVEPDPRPPFAYTVNPSSVLRINVSAGVNNYDGQFTFSFSGVTDYVEVINIMVERD
jgi:hypothetical protein